MATIAATAPMAAAATAAGFKALCRIIGYTHSNPIWKRKIPSMTSISFSSAPPIIALPTGNHQPSPWGASFCAAPNGSANVTVEPSSSNSSNHNDNDNNNADDNGGEINIKDAGNMLDIRVGRIIKAWRHEDADSLYVEEVDVGEPQPRIICSGLVNYIPLHLLQDAQVVVLANLKPRNMRGVKSCGMLLAASDASHQNVELLLPPQGSLPGDRIWFGTQDDQQKLPVPATPNQIQKKKIWELVQPHLKTDAACIAMLGEHLMWTPAGTVTSRSLQNAKVS